MSGSLAVLAAQRRQPSQQITKRTPQRITEPRPLGVSGRYWPHGGIRSLRPAQHCVGTHLPTAAAVSAAGAAVRPNEARPD